MTIPHHSYRSDTKGRIYHSMHFHTLEIAIWTLAATVVLALWLGGDYSPIEILKAKGGL